MGRMFLYDVLQAIRPYQPLAGCFNDEERNDFNRPGDIIKLSGKDIPGKRGKG